MYFHPEGSFLIVYAHKKNRASIFYRNVRGKKEKYAEPFPLSLPYFFFSGSDRIR